MVRRTAQGVWWSAALRAAASESAVGVWAMAAASRRWRAAIWKTWPPEAQKLQVASLTGSTSGKAAANVIAACQSASLSVMRWTWRGYPPLSPIPR